MATIRWHKEHNLEITSLPREEFNFDAWRSRIIQKFTEIGFSNPEEEFEKRRSDESATFWFPDKQDKPKVFFIEIHVEGDEKFVSTGDIIASQIRESFKKTDGS